MNSLALLFEIVVIGSTCVSLAALVGFIISDSLVDARRMRNETSPPRALPISGTRSAQRLEPKFSHAA